MRARVSAPPDDHRREEPLLEVLPVGLLLLDDSGRVLSISAEMERMLGCRVTSLSDSAPDWDDFPRDGFRALLSGDAEERQTISIRDFRTGETQSVSLLSFTAEVEPFRRRSAP